MRYLISLFSNVIISVLIASGLMFGFGVQKDKLDACEQQLQELNHGHDK